MGLQETFLLQSILKRKASFFGHIARGSAGEELKMIIAEGWRKVGRGRRRRRWMDDVELVMGTKDAVQITERIIDDSKIKIDVMTTVESPGISPTTDSSFGYQIIKRAIFHIHPNAVTVPLGYIQGSAHGGGWRRLALKPMWTLPSSTRKVSNML
ncbi:hypothetical protein GQR58_014440 [Nymphon striatum]|nr:hypothetical protein GQR58_014440 [Nymphon striatum]